MLSKIRNYFNKQVDALVLKRRLQRIERTTNFRYLLGFRPPVNVIFREVDFHFSNIKYELVNVFDLIPENFTGILILETKAQTGDLCLCYFKNGKYFREHNQPVVMFTKRGMVVHSYLWKNEDDEYHNYIGPAIIETESNSVSQIGIYVTEEVFFLFGKKINNFKEIQNWYLDNGINIGLMTPEDEVLIRMRWG